MSQSYTPYAGKTSSVTIASSAALPFNRYGWSITADMIDVTAFTSASFREFIAGLKTGTFVFGGNMNSNWNPFTQAPVLKIGTSISTVVITIGGTLVATATYALVAHWDISGSPPGAVEYVCAIQADYTFSDFNGTNTNA